MANDKKHILFLTPGFPKDENDFNCIPPFQNFLEKFITEYPSIKISVLAFQYPYQNKHYEWNRINVIPLKGENIRLKKPFIWLRTIREAERIHNIINI